MLRNLGDISADLDPLKKALVREAAVKQFKLLKFNAPGRLVDAALPAVTSNGSKASQGKAVVFEELEPWPEAADGAALLQEIQELVPRYVVTNSCVPLTVAVFTLFSYSFNCFETCPILVISSPEKRCGKTCLIELLTCLVGRPLAASNVSPAALYRAIEEWEPTLLIDEADSFLRDNEELRGVLNSGHRRTTAFILRTAGDDHEPRRFSTWGPKVIALIKQLPATLEDRSIVIHMSRKRTAEQVERLKPSRLDREVRDVRRRCLRWVQDNEAVLRRAEPEGPAGLHDRAHDNWEPLLAIADLCGAGGELRSAALELSGLSPEDDNSISIQLLSDIQKVLEEIGNGVSSISSEELAKRLADDKDSPWSEWRRGKPLSPRSLASLLKPFGIKPKQVKVDGVNRRRYRFEDFEDTFSRYVPGFQVLPPLPSSPHAGVSQFDEVLPTPPGSTSEKALKPSVYGEGSGGSTLKRGVGETTGSRDPDSRTEGFVEGVL